MNVSVFSARLPTPYPHTPSLVLKKIQIINMLDFPHLFLLFTGKNKYKKCKLRIKPGRPNKIIQGAQNLYIPIFKNFIILQDLKRM